jgi:RTX calcium-binding nonapeptide repeat (4 copies)
VTEADHRDLYPERRAPASRERLSRCSALPSSPRALGCRLDPWGEWADVCSYAMLRRMAFVVSALVLVAVAGPVAQAQGRLCFAREATITGTDGPDILQGTPGNDVILGLGGDDVVFGGKGNDRICSGGGADSITGGPGADRIDGNADADTIAAGGGKDLANGGTGNDSIGGGSGRDRLVGQGGSDVLDGGGGRDWVGYFLARGDVRANLSTHRASGEGLDTIVHVEDLEGSPYDDVLVGDAGRNEIDGGNGSDVLLGYDATDRLLGGRGDDTLRGGAGADVLDDSLRVAQGVFPDTGVDLLAGGPGKDRLRARDDVRGNDALKGGAGDDACSADPGDAVSGCRP